MPEPTAPRGSGWHRLALLIAGGGLAAAGGLLSSAGIEHALVSDPARSLAWGPALFRLLLVGHGVALMAVGLSSGPRSHPPPPPIRPRGGTRAPWLALGALSLLALGLRLWRLNSGLWSDEVFSLVTFVRPSLGDIVTSFSSQNQNMLYSVLAHVSVRLFGESAWALRLPAVLFGVGSLWAVFLLGRRIIGTREALLACALMTVSYHHIWFSQDARGYTGLLFFATLATWLWLEARERGRWAWWMCYSLTVALGMWVHLTLAFVIAAHVLIELPTWRRAGARWRWQAAAAWTLCASLSLQLYALSLPEFLSTALHQVSVPAVWTSPWWTLRETVRSLAVGFSRIPVVICGGGLVAVGWIDVLRRDWRAGLAMALPAVLAGGTLLALEHYIWPRFFFFAMGFGLLILIHGAMTIPRLLGTWMPQVLSPRRAAVGGFALTGALIVISAATLPRCYAPKQDFAGARDYVEAHRRPGDAVTAVGVAGFAYGMYYAPQWSVSHTAAQLEDTLRTHTRVWLVYTLPVQVQADFPAVWRVIDKDFQIVKVFPGTLGGGGVYVCRRRVRTAAPLSHPGAPVSSASPGAR